MFEADSLLEQRARGVAEMWMKHDCLTSELEALGDSTAGLPFKMAVAVHLEGRHLAAFVEHYPKGLFGLMMDASPQSFFRLLAVCIGVTSRVFEDSAVQRRIWNCIMAFQRDCRVGQITHHSLHWHGLSAVFNWDMTTFPEGPMKYYRQLTRRAIECNKFELPYPLHPDLIMRGKEVDLNCKRQFILDSCAFMSEYCRDRNPDAQRDKMGLERCDDSVTEPFELQSLSEQFFLVLCSMAASAQSR